MSGTKTEPKLNTPPVAEAEPAWAKALSANIAALSGHMEKVVSVLSNPPKPQAQAQPAATPSKTTNDDFVMPDANTLETLPRTQFLDLIERKMTATMRKQMVEPLTEQLNSLRTGLNSSQIEKMISSTSAKFKDFEDFIPEMTELAKTRANLTPEELYHLAKTKATPEKLKEVETKHSAPNPTDKLKEFTFGGFMPSNGSDDAANRRMEPRAAADDAWDKVVAEMGGTPAFTQ